MSGENVEIVIAQFEAVNSGEGHLVPDAWADDITLVLHGELRAGGGEGADGKPAVMAWFADWFARFQPSYRFQVEQARDLGDRVLLFVTHHGRGRSSGVPVSFETAYLYTLARGLINGIDIWASRRASLEALGLSE